jgi:hypothetical protein
MSKATKKKLKSKAAVKLPRGLMENMFVETDLDAHLKQMTAASGISVSSGHVEYIARSWRNPAEGWVNLAITAGPNQGAAFFSVWPEWAYNIAEGALHFNKQMMVSYDSTTLPMGNSLLGVICLKS